MLQQPITTDQLYGVFGNSWRVSQADSCFDYLPGQSTATFTDPNFPADVVTLSSLPQNLVTNAAAMVTAAGITNPTIANAAELDYLATGDPSFITSAANIQQANLANSSATVMPSAPPVETAGVAAEQAAVVESASGTTPVVFDVYLTSPDSVDVPIAYQVVTGGTGDLAAAAFGGVLPAGTVVIPAGQTTGQFTIQVPNGALGTLPTANVRVQISTPNGEALFASTAQTAVVNNLPEPGAPAVPQLVYLGTAGVFTHTGNAYTLELSTVQNSAVPPLQFGVENGAVSPSDLLSGTFGMPTGSGFVVTGAGLPAALTAGQGYFGLYSRPRQRRSGRRRKRSCSIRGT